MPESDTEVAAQWDALRSALQPLSPEVQEATLAQFADVVRKGVHAWINRPREDEFRVDTIPPASYDSIASREEFISWAHGLLRRLEEHPADVAAHPEDWKPDWEDTWANTDLGAYLEAMVAIIQARRKGLDWRFLAEVMESATCYE